ncbi:MAG: endonuclease III [Gemmatimonadaceae bacterium]|nr:endonuclease III [Gemmatimonadaceae bacterium]
MTPARRAGQTTAAPGGRRTKAPVPAKGSKSAATTGRKTTATPTPPPSKRLVLRTRFAQLKGTALKQHAAAVYGELARLYPTAHCELVFRDAYELTVATILSAQCTDKRVNMVTPAVFAAYPDAAALAVAPQEHVEELVKTTGFFRAKAKSLVGMAQAVVAKHGGQIPAAMDDLVVLPGVGRKTANVVLGNAFGINHGVVVDTHVGRLSNRLGLTKASDPVKIESALIPLFPRETWTMLSHLLIWHGRQVCDARSPRCGSCTLRSRCPSAPLDQ